LPLKPLAGASAIRRRVERHQRVVLSADSFDDTGSQRTPDIGVRSVRARIAIAAEDPDEILARLVACAEPTAVDSRVGRREDLWSNAPRILPHLVAPRRQEADVESKLRGAIEDEVDVLEIGVAGLRGIVVPQRQLTVRVGDGESTELRECD